MIRRNLTVAVAVIVSVVLTACSDISGPQNNLPCPVTNGSGVCAK
jgi:hypothetical protein